MQTTRAVRPLPGTVKPAISGNKREHTAFGKDQFKRFLRIIGRKYIFLFKSDQVTYLATLRQCTAKPEVLLIAVDRRDFASKFYGKVAGAFAISAAHIHNAACRVDRRKPTRGKGVFLSRRRGIIGRNVGNHIFCQRTLRNSIRPITSKITETI